MLAIAMPIPLLGRREGGQEAMVSASLLLRKGGLGSWSSSSHMRRKVGSGHVLCPSIPEKVRSVVMAMLIPILEGREGGQGAMVSALLEQRNEEVSS